MAIAKVFKTFNVSSRLDPNYQHSMLNDEEDGKSNGKTVGLSATNPISLKSYDVDEVALDRDINQIITALNKLIDLPVGNPVTFANLTIAPTHGMLAAITDSTTTTWGATITGGGANKVLGFYNGSNWTVAGK